MMLEMTVENIVTITYKNLAYWFNAKETNIEEAPVVHRAYPNGQKTLEYVSIMNIGKTCSIKAKYYFTKFTECVL